MKPILYWLLLAICSCFSSTSRSQTAIWNSASFSISKDTSSLIGMNDATPIVFSGAFGNAPMINFPSSFEFRFGLTNFNKVSISSYGYIKLGGEIFAVNPTLQDSIVSALYNFPSSFTTCSYKLIGNAPNRTFVIEWSGTYAFVGTIKFQLWLSERIGRIQLVYGGLRNYRSGNGYSIYCKAKILSQPVVASLKTKTLNQAPTVNYSGIETNNYDSISPNTRFIFQPDTLKPIQPGKITFANVLPGCLNVVIKDSSINESVFRAERKDRNSFNLAAQYISTSSLTIGMDYTYNNTRLQPDSDYTYRAFASNGFLNSDTVVETIHTPMPQIFGTKKIPGDYTSINSLLQDAACKHIGPDLVIELQPSYNFSDEGGAVYFYPFLQTKILKHISLRPAAGSSHILSASVNNPMLLIDSVRNVEIDGRAGGTGQINNLTLRQLNDQWPVISYIRYADSGAVRFCNIEGNLKNGNFGLIYLGSYNPPYYTFLTNGVVGTTISNCKVGPQSSFAYKGIVVESSGRGENIIIRDNDIFRFYNEAIEYRYGGKNSRIVNNRLFQPDPVPSLNNTPQAAAAMTLTEVGDNFTVEGNTIGGSSPVWGVGNWRQNNFSTSGYAVISITTNLYGATSFVLNNQIANISGSGFNSTLREISVGSGASIIDGNKIGSADSINSIVNNGSHSAIGVSGRGIKVIRNNLISGLQTNYPNFSGNRELVLITASNVDSLFIANNDIGGSDNYNANRTDGQARGIGLLAVKDAEIKNNIIHGISSQTKGVWGISEEWEGTTPTPKNMIFDSNKIHHLEGRITVYGLYARLYSTKSSSFSNNHIYALRGIGPANSPNANQPPVMLGLSVQESTYTGAVDTNRVLMAKNNIHSLDYVSPSPYSSYLMTGIAASGRRIQLNNNMIALGIGKNGSPTDSVELEITAIDATPVIKGEIEHNSIYIGGVGHYANGIVFPVNLNSNKNIFLSNNIIQIDRYKPVHNTAYDYISGKNSTTTGLINNVVSNNNIWYSKKDINVNSKLNAWRSKCSCDSASFNEDPHFVNAIGDSVTQNLHLMPSSPADSTGGPSFSNILDDIDGNVRASFTPTDIGADAIGPCTSTENVSLVLSIQQDSLAVCTGSEVNISVNVLGGNVTSLQWQRNFQNVTGDTTTTFLVRQQGWYRVIGKTVCGQVASKTLYVSFLPASSQVKITQKDTTICLGNSINFFATGGDTYTWKGPQIDLAGPTISVQPSSAGDYKYIVSGTSGGCTSFDTIKLNVAQVPIVSITGADTAISCMGSVALSTISDDTYTYQWFKEGIKINGATSTQYIANASGSYTVEVTSANGCTGVSTPLRITQNIQIPAPTISLSGPAVLCGVGNTLLSSSALNGNQWYKDSVLITGATKSTYTPTSTGNYTVRASSGSCTSSFSNSIEIKVENLPTVNVSASGATTFCEGENVILKANQDIAYKYQWYKDDSTIAGATQFFFQVTTSGNYLVKISSNNCSTQSQVSSVFVNPRPTKPIITQSDATLISSASTGNQWYLNDTIIPGATNKLYEATSSGIYTVKSTENGCTASSDTFPFQANTNVGSGSWSSNISILPNPVANELRIQNPDGLKINIRIVNAGGNMVNQFVSTQAATTTINMQHLPSGMYWIIVKELTKNETYTKLVLKL